MSSESTEVWTGWYRDRRGAEAIAITADGGRRIAIRVRGVEYTGSRLEALTADEENGGLPLSGCVLEWDLPMPVILADGSVQPATLSCLLALGEALSDGSPERVDLQLTLHWGGAAYESGLWGGDFEQALDRVRRQLPPGTRFERTGALVEAAV
ncbi:DUF6304 family protein [Streptomyces lichenis]|uniref:DUF6304 family protein n=1 Tax=Streptomyces lichenis TaxID=2306967 RepID=A0ABT0I7S4_9ACTN|nr:DUF6304 family protein [Streptomyces lichenis]MCK8677370.1 DUF6304 family protein [Streptomyces lichenis]